MAHFHQRLRHSFNAHQPLVSLICGPAAAAAAIATTSVTRLEEQPETKIPTDRSVEFVGIFLAKEAADKLRVQYPSKFAVDNHNDQLFVVLKYNPTEKEKEVFAPILGRTAKLHIKGYVEDENTQAVLVDVTTETGDPIDFDGGGEYPHVTVASLDGQESFNSAHSSVLLERLRTSGKLQWLLEKEENVAEWSGELPEFESKQLALFNPFPSSKVSVKPATTKTESLEGTVCFSSTFDAESGTCLSAPEKAECGFCKFMKAGPCGKEFTAWEACLDRCKKNGSDFIEHCGMETLALRDCVDANPEYYHVLNDPPENEESE